MNIKCTEPQLWTHKTVKTILPQPPASFWPSLKKVTDQILKVQLPDKIRLSGYQRQHIQYSYRCLYASNLWPRQVTHLSITALNVSIWNLLFLSNTASFSALSSSNQDCLSWQSHNLCYLSIRQSTAQCVNEPTQPPRPQCLADAEYFACQWE